MLIGWQNIELFVLPPARRGIAWAATPAFWYEFENVVGFCVGVPLCIFFLAVIGERKCVVDESSALFGDVGARCFDDRYILSDSLLRRCTKVW